MKIRDLNKGEYIIVYDLGKSEYSEGMTVAGKVIELEFDDDDKNKAVIDSVGNLYTITDENYFDNWQDHMESITESVSNKWISNAMESEQEKLRNTIRKSVDLQQRKRRNIKLIDSETVEFENGRQMKVIINNRKTKPTSVYWVDDKTIGFDNGSRIRVPEYYTRENSNDTVNHPSHYNYGEIEIIDVIEQVTQHYNANVAYHIGNAIKYLARSPHKNGKEDVAKAKWYIERAFENWDK